MCRGERETRVQTLIDTLPSDAQARNLDFVAIKLKILTLAAKANKVWRRRGACSQTLMLTTRAQRTPSRFTSTARLHAVGCMGVQSMRVRVRELIWLQLANLACATVWTRWGRARHRINRHRA